MRNHSDRARFRQEIARETRMFSLIVYLYDTTGIDGYQSSPIIVIVIGHCMQRRS